MKKKRTTSEKKVLSGVFSFSELKYEKVKNSKERDSVKKYKGGKNEHPVKNYEWTKM